jgi:hypothetical protein
VEVYGNRVEITGGGNSIVLIQRDRGSGTFDSFTTTGNQIHDNTVVDHDGHGYIGGFADYNEAGMLDGGNTWSNNQYFMADGEGRFEWGGSKTFSQFKEAAHETGSLSQSYPDTSGWLTGSSAESTPTPPVDPTPTPPGGPTLNEVTGTNRDDVLIGTSGDDLILGLRGNDRLSGNDGADLIFGGSGSGHSVGRHRR